MNQMTQKKTTIKVTRGRKVAGTSEKPKTRLGKQECQKNAVGGDPEASSATFDVTQKRAIVFVEIGENMRIVLCKAIECAYDASENIGETLSEMGFNVQEMIDSTVQMEGNSVESGVSKK